MPKGRNGVVFSLSSSAQVSQDPDASPLGMLKRGSSSYGSTWYLNQSCGSGLDRLRMQQDDNEVGGDVGVIEASEGGRKMFRTLKGGF